MGPDKEITFEEAKIIVPQGIQALINARADEDEVSEAYAELWVKEYYVFYVDSEKPDVVWVETDQPIEPAYWNSEQSRWIGEGDDDEDDLKDFLDEDL